MCVLNLYILIQSVLIFITIHMFYISHRFNGGKWCLIIANVFGCMAFFTLIMASCCPLDAKKMAGLSCYYWIATLFQIGRAHV